MYNRSVRRRQPINIVTALWQIKINRKQDNIKTVKLRARKVI